MLLWSMAEVVAGVVLVVVCVAAVWYWREVVEGVRELREYLKAIDDLWAGPGR